MAETKKDYIEIERMVESMKDELTRPRCANCDANFNRTCTIFKMEIPDDHEYRYTECEHWRPAIPF